MSHSKQRRLSTPGRLLPATWKQKLSLLFSRHLYVRKKETVISFSVFQRMEMVVKRIQNASR